MRVAHRQVLLLDWVDTDSSESRFKNLEGQPSPTHGQLGTVVVPRVLFLAKL